MFRGLWEAKTRVILLKIENFYNKSGVKFALSHKNSEKIFYSNSYTRKMTTFFGPYLGRRGSPKRQNGSKRAKSRKRSARVKIFEPARWAGCQKNAAVSGRLGWSDRPPLKLAPKF